MKAIFLDFDGVILVAGDPPDGSLIVPPAQWSKRAMDHIAHVCFDNNAVVVITSDWRCLPESMAMQEFSRSPLSTHFNGGRKTRHALTRWREVQAWLLEHPEVTGYAILEDDRRHFVGAPPDMVMRVVWCNNRYGFVPSLFPKLEEILEK